MAIAGLLIIGAAVGFFMGACWMLARVGRSLGLDDDDDDGWGLGV